MGSLCLARDIISAVGVRYGKGCTLLSFNSDLSGSPCFLETFQYSFVSPGDMISVSFGDNRLNKGMSFNPLGLNIRGVYM